MSELALKLIRENIVKHQRGEDASFLDLGNCGMTEVPEEIGECVWVQRLSFSGEWIEWADKKKKKFHSANNGKENVLKFFPEKLSKLQSLKTIIFNNNPVSDLEPLSGLTKLQLLSAYSTEIKDLTPISKLKNLKQISCGSTQIKDLSPLASLSNLFLLYCFNNKIDSLESITKLKKLQVLSCGSTQIKDLEPILKLKNLEIISIKSTLINDFRPLESLSKLRQIYCSSTSMEDLSWVKKLSSLEILNCNWTSISDLSPLTHLNNLLQFYCCWTPVNNLEPLSNLTNLNLLDCNSTTISDLSPLAKLQNLQFLDCNSTPIADLSPLANLVNLKLLDCSSTRVRDLSPLFPLIKKNIPIKWNSLIYHFEENRKTLEENAAVLVRNCPLVTPPPEIVQQGNEAILNYFIELKTGTQKSLEAKVVLIGEGMSGKTSLRTRLIKGEAASLPPKDERTKGMEVEIEPFYVPLPSGESIRLNLFDFGGQKHYKPLHQFFYSNRSLYVLVTRNGDDSNEFDFWLDTAQLFGGGSPVLVVNNLFGDVPSGFSRSKYARFDAILKDSLDANLDSCKGFPAVKKRIEQLADDLPHIHLEIPKTWAKVRAALEKLRNRNIIPLTEYLELCAQEENGGMDKERALFCSAYLHDIGACLHYQQFPALKRHIIVRNEWATEAVYRVMDDAAVGKKNGHFHRDDLDRIWQVSAEDRERGDDFGYENYQPELLELMRRFKLCYPLKSGDEFVAPHLLPTKQDSDLRWQPDNDLQFEVEYDFMPPALFSRFVVSRYEDISGENRNLVWSDEVFFNWENNAIANVRVPSRAGKKAIVFRVQGGDPEAKKLLLTSLLRDLKKLHAETPGIVAEERIPCICNSCRDAVEPTFYPYSNLKTRKDNHKRGIECNKPPFEEVLIDDLLGNIFSKKENQSSGKVAHSREQIEKLLISDDIKEALELLKNTGSEDAILYLARFQRNRREYSAGAIDKGEHDRTVAQLRMAVIDLLND